MTSVVVVTSDPTITVTQDNPAVTVILPVTQFPLTQLGISLALPLNAAADFNTLMTAGFFYTADLLSTNTPIASNLWYLNVDVDGADPTNFCRQTATTLATIAATYIRTMIDGAWGTWQPVVVLDSLGRMPAADGSLLTNVNAGISSKVPDAISGLTLSTTGSTPWFSVAPGVANDSTNATNMSLPSIMSKIPNLWAAGNGNGALDTSSVAASTWYHVFIISNTVTADVLISLSLIPLLPTGYTLYRRIGSMLTNGSSNWTSFLQIGDEFLWSAPFADIAGSGLGNVSVLFQLSVPPDLSVIAKCNFEITTTSGAMAVLFQSPLTTTLAVSGGNAQGIATVGSGNGGAGQIAIMTDTTQNIRAVANTSGGTQATYVHTTGWTDFRGKL
jgi:hypothetical protein